MGLVTKIISALVLSVMCFWYLFTVIPVMVAKALYIGFLPVAVILACCLILLHRIFR